MSILTILPLVNSLLSISNVVANRNTSDRIYSVERKLRYITDDLTWLESNDITSLLSNQSKLRADYEKVLEGLFSSSMDSEDLFKSLEEFSRRPEFNDQAVLDVFLSQINSLSFLLTATSEMLMNMFNLQTETLDKLLVVINEMNAIRLKHKLDLGDLQAEVASNRSIILKLSEQQLSFRLQTLEDFRVLREELEYINTQVDKKLADVGVLSSNTTGVILNDGTFKLAENLSLYQGEVFEASLTEEAVGSATSQSQHAAWTASTSSAMPYVSLSLTHPGGIGAVSSSSYYPKVSLTSSKKIKKFSKPDHDGVGLLLNSRVKLLLNNIDPARSGYLFLRGAGLSVFEDGNIKVKFFPTLGKVRTLSRSESGYIRTSEGYTNAVVGHYLSSSSVRSVKLGDTGSVLYPMVVTGVTTLELYTAKVFQKSDNLIVIKIDRRSDYPAQVTGSSVKSAYVWGQGAPCNPYSSPYKALFSNNVGGHVYDTPSSAELMSGGHFVIDLPANFLSFQGVEFAQ